MNDDIEVGTDAPSGQSEWSRALDSLERGLREASQATALLRKVLRDAVPDVSHQGSPPVAQDTLGAATEEPSPDTEAAAPQIEAPTPPPAAPAPDKPKAGSSAFDHLWERIEREKIEREAPEVPSPRGLDALPQQYLMTVEDQEGKVDLVPLHRGLAAIEGVQEVSLVSYANGVPVVSLRVEGELDTDRLGEAAAQAMDRQCEVIRQDSGRLYLRMRAWGRGESAGG